MVEMKLLALASIPVIAMLCQWLAWRVRLPAILFLLLSGILAGPVLGWLDPQALFGDLLFPIVSLAVAMVLFEGSLTLKFDEIRGLERVVRNLVTVGLLLTWLVTSVTTHWLVGFSWQLSFLFGALVVVTGPTVIVPILRTVRPNAAIANILRWEGIVIDPIGAWLAVLVFEFILSQSATDAWGHTLIVFFKVLAVGILTGAGAGYSLGLVLRHHWLPEYLHNVSTLAVVVGIFALSNHLETESGLLAVTVMGVWLANMRNVAIQDILNFKESLSVLLISGLFIILAARIDFAQFQTLGWAALGVLAAIQFVARPLKVMLSTLGSSLNWRERSLLAWIAPRGIVAAAVSALFALRLEEAGFTDAPLLVPLTFMIIIGTVVLQSATAGPLARALKVADPEPRGVLIVGANPVARALAQALNDQGLATLVTDSNWDYIKTARMQGLRTYYGNVVSEHADRHLDLVGIGRLLGLSPHTELNALATLKYRTEFGAKHVYSLATASKKMAEKHTVSPERRGYILFSEQAAYASLASWIGQGAEIRCTQITDAFSYADWLATHGDQALPLFWINAKDQIEFFVAEGESTPGSGSTIASLLRADPDTED